MLAPVLWTLLRRYHLQSEPFRCFGPHQTLYLHAQYSACQCDQSVNRGYGKHDGRDAEDDVRRKVKVKARSFDGRVTRRFSLFSNWLSDVVIISTGLKCQIDVESDLPK